MRISSDIQNTRRRNRMEKFEKQLNALPSKPRLKESVKLVNAKSHGSLLHPHFDRRKALLAQPPGSRRQEGAKTNLKLPAAGAKRFSARARS